MGLIRLFFYEQPISFTRFAVESLTLAGVIGTASGLAIATSLMLLH